MDTLALIWKAHYGDKDAKAQLVEENTGLIWSVVKRFMNRGCEKEDLFQIGSIGLIKAIDKFDESYQVQFSTYAVPLITGEIKRFLRDDGMIKVSRVIKENQVKVMSCSEEFRNKYGREASIGELSEKTGLEKEEIITALEAAREIESLHKVIYSGENSEISIMDRLEDKRNEENNVIEKMYIQQLMSTLEEKEKKIILMRYFQNMTQSEIANILGTSQVQVSRMEKKILERLRKYA